MRRWMVHAQLWRDPVLGAAGIWTALIGLAFFALDGQTDWQVRVFWVAQLPLDVLLAWSSWQVCRLATGPIRRFWAVVAAVGTLFTVGDTVQTLTVMFGDDPMSTNGGVFQSTCFTVGLGAIIIAMLVHPHPSRSGRERLAFWLDSLTVLIGGAVVAWCFAVRPGQSSEADILATLAGGAVATCSCFAAVKLVLSRNAPIHKAGAIPMIGSAAFTTTGLLLAGSGTADLAPWVYVIRLLPSLLIAAGPRVQEILAHLEPEPFGARKRKPYSLLPYGSMAVAFVALAVIMPSGRVDPRMWGVVVGLALICALVVCRQLAAFHDNTSLINQLDTTLAELREKEAKLRHQALFDGLTELANRTHFHDEVAAALDRRDRTSVLLIDLDGFKAVNDTMGHAAGDTLLEGVAAKLRAATRDGDLAARLGGDEFAVLLHDCDGAEGERTAQRIFEAFAVPVEIGGTPVRARASIGVTDAEPGDDVESLLRRADVAMYAAKSEGKGVCRRYHPGMENMPVR